MAFLVGGAFAIEAVSLYWWPTPSRPRGAFAVMTLLPPPDATRDADLVDGCRGLFWLRPGLSLALAAALLSLAGIPLTVGFIAKFYAMASGADGGHGVLLGALVTGSIMGLYYYLRIIVAMAAPPPAAAAGRQPPQPGGQRRQLGKAVLAALVLLLIGLGAYPAPLLTLIRATASMVAR